MKHLQKLAVLILFCLALPQGVARDYITQEQLSSATVIDLPGRIKINSERERNPENMAAHTLSTVSTLLTEYSGLTLGMVGGVAALGFMGVISAPIAVLTAAAVGGLALAGIQSGGSNAPVGLSQMNYGHQGKGRPPVYNASSTFQRDGGVRGLLGISQENRFRYPVGSSGVSTQMRAPVHVNMGFPHVSNTVGRGYGFNDYNRGYSDASPIYSGNRGPSNPQASPSGGSSASPGSPYNSGFGPSPAPGYYDRRGRETLGNFFPRLDGAGVQGGSRGTRGERQRIPGPWWSGPGYDRNWQQNSYQPRSRLSQSWQYTPGNTWRATSPQGRMFRYPGRGFGAPGAGRPPRQQIQPIPLPSGPQYGGQQSGNRAFPGAELPDPFEFKFHRPRQGYDLSPNLNYPMGRAYQAPGLPGNFQRTFVTPVPGTLNQGFQPQPFNSGQVFPAVSGATPPQIQPMGLVQPQGLNTMVRPPEPIRKPVERVNPIASPEQTQARHEASDQAQETILENEAGFLQGAMAPGSSGFDHKRLSKLEADRQEAYKNLIKAMKIQDEKKQKHWLDRYQSILKDIRSLTK